MCTVDEFTEYDGKDRGLKYWSWTYYRQPVVVERLDIDNEHVMLPLGPCNDKDWHRWLNAEPSRSP